MALALHRTQDAPCAEPRRSGSTATSAAHSSDLRADQAVDGEAGELVGARRAWRSTRRHCAAHVPIASPSLSRGTHPRAVASDGPVLIMPGSRGRGRPGTDAAASRGHWGAGAAEAGELDEDLAPPDRLAAPVEDVAGQPAPAGVRQLGADRDDAKGQGAIPGELHRGAAVNPQQVTRLRVHRYQ
ncbi:hypothetical protein [Micromonospora sp. MS34]|uniref:hypothetical protein n=1 Tax=Micromonospora sp. MS34 TaxID=3385971 RepID=UPI00399F763C